MRINPSHRKDPAIAVALLMVTVLCLALSDQTPQSSRASSDSHGPVDSDSAGSLPAKISSPDQSKLREWIARLPLRFELNRGQTSSEVKFLARHSGSELSLS